VINKGQGVAYGNLGFTYRNLGDYHTAMANLVQSSLIFLKLDNPDLRQILNTQRNIYLKLGAAEFEKLVQTTCQSLGVDYTQYHTLLTQHRVFEPLKLNDYQQSLVQDFAFACLGIPQASIEVEQWIAQNKAKPNWAKLAAMLPLLLAGERNREVLLDPAHQLDEIDHKIIEETLAAIQEQLAQTQSGDTLDAELDQALGLALRGDKQARQMFEEQILPQLEKAGSNFEALAKVIQKLFTVDMQEWHTLLPEAFAILDNTNREILQKALQIASAN
jgi:hypothetical protein